MSSLLQVVLATTTAAMVSAQIVSLHGTVALHDFIRHTGTSASCPMAYREPDDNWAIVGCGADNVRFH